MGKLTLKKSWDSGSTVSLRQSSITLLNKYHKGDFEDEIDGKGKNL